VVRRPTLSGQAGRGSWELVTSRDIQQWMAQLNSDARGLVRLLSAQRVQPTFAYLGYHTCGRSGADCGANTAGPTNVAIHAATLPSNSEPPERTTSWLPGLAWTTRSDPHRGHGPV
jgi:hypothetical protein